MKNLSKKVVGVLTVLLLMSSSLDASIVDYGNNCFGLASWVYDYVIANGGSVIEAVTESGGALRWCAAAMQ